MRAWTEYIDHPNSLPDGPGWPPISRRHAMLFGLTGLVYLLVVVGVLCDTRLVDADWALMLFRPYEHWPGLQPYLDVWVVAGQRGPTAIAACSWLAWRCYRMRTTRPLLVMGGALLLLNVTVGGVKIVTGRLGPHYANYVGSPELFSGGDIFPSGHTANAVVTWGVLAYLAVRLRRTGAALAGATAVSVGLTTLYLGTHWLSDVLAGWAAGLLVLLALPLAEPPVRAVDAWITARWRAHRATTATGTQPTQARSTTPSRTVRLSRSARYSMVISAPGASSRTARQPHSAASPRARSTASPR